jgi:PTH1 family peptidyl-tRNA hydrolase
MKLIVGLGNYGKEYQNTRHNIGFMALDHYAQKNNLNIDKKKFKGLYTEISIDGEKVLLVKPQTYMNLSGECMRDFILYFHIDIKDVLVIYDDMDLDVGVLRLREKGSAGGHNGMKNIIQHMKTSDFKRVRVGISKDINRNTIDYVLGKFNEEDKRIIDEKMEIISCIIEDFVKYDFNKVMSKYN